MTIEKGDIIDQAVAWHLRQRDIAPDDWQQFIAWLEGDPAHAAAYDRLALVDALLPAAPSFDAVPLHALPIAANDDAPVMPQRRLWRWATGAGAVAAAVVALLVIPQGQAPQTDKFTVATAAGERRSVDLGDGGRIDLSGSSQVQLDRKNPRVAALVSGEALFHIHHDDARPFTLVAGDYTVRDVGTVFNAVRDGKTFQVAVAEGGVIFQPEHQAVRLRPGDALSADGDAQNIALRRVAIESVGGWRQGRVSFYGQPLSRLADAVHRLYAVTIVLTPRLSQRPFTGIITFTGAAEKDIPHIAALVGAKWRRDGRQWYLSDGEAVAPVGAAAVAAVDARPGDRR